jgi:hypothetical protein
VIAIWTAVRSGQQSRAAASRAIVAAQTAETHAARVVEALETLASGLGAAPAKVRWEIEQISSSRYRLTNIGHATAHGATLEGADSLLL